MKPTRGSEGSGERLDRIERLIEELVATSKLNEERWQKNEEQWKEDHERWRKNEERWQQQEIENRVILERIDTYQKTSTQVVNLAFSLIAAATVTVIISSVLGR